MIPANYTEIDTLYRHIVSRNVRRFAVASVSPGEGATTLAYSLARRASRAGKRVLLIDLNVYKPSLGALLGVERVEWNPNIEDLTDKIVNFGSDGMSVLPAPLDEPLSPAFRETGSLERMLDRLEESYDLIVLDIAPLLLSNARNVPPFTVSRAARTVLLAVMMRVTRQANLERATALLADEGISILGVAASDRDNPSLGAELEREAMRLNPVFPAGANWLARQIRKVGFLYERP
ncbi:AAA family ATPase [Nisaea sp.]|uniref:AAA family ATPase n=1 Tax=Nisaea sp. TaxID=2024842 RepID=UPI002B279202|nr:hypothetical protein [Nisaea sp.]